MPCPFAVRQTNSESEFHEVVAHLVGPTRGSGVASSKPKFRPIIVRLAPLVLGAFTIDKAVTLGPL